MKIILATDPIFWPLTGIGRYTFELAVRLITDPRIIDIRFFNLGRWKDSASIQAFENDDSTESGHENLGQRLFGFARKLLANNESAVKAYSRISPYLYAKRLAPYSGEYLYHSPNFVLPKFNGKKVATFHDLSILKYPQFHPESRLSVLRPEILKAAECADHIITDSEAVRREVIDWFARSEDEVTAVPLASTLTGITADAPELESFLSRHRLADRRFFLFVSTIEPRKNIDRMLDAYELLPSSFKRQHPLVLTGSSGWKSKAILERIKLLGKNGTVRYLGYTSNKELEYLYRATTALVFPSLYEGFGLPVIEAQSMGAPVITSNLSCMPEVAGNSALFVDPYDVDAIRGAFERMVHDEDLRRVLCASGPENARLYSWEATCEKTLNVYQKVFSS